MATTWEIHDGQQQVGPLDEEHVLRMIAAGLPATTVVRPAGAEEWRNVRTHAPFAIAMAGRANMAPALAPPTQARPAAPPSKPSMLTHPYTIAALGAGVGFVVLLVLGLTQRSLPPTPALVITSPAPDPSTVAPRPPAPPEVVKGSNGGWAVIPRPGLDADSRIVYMRQVSEAAPGEPKLDKKAAGVLLTKLRLSMEKLGSLPAGSIKASLGETAGAMIVPPGVSATLLVHGHRQQSFPVCSEAFLGTGMVDAEISPSDFANAGMRGLICKSDGCSAIFDMRPTSVGGGVYGGPSCLHVGEMVKLVAPE